MQGQKGYQEKLYTNFQLSDHVPQDNFYRRLKEVLDLRFLYKETEKFYGKTGQKSIDPTVFFRILLVAVSAIGLRGILYSVSSIREIGSIQCCPGIHTRFSAASAANLTDRIFLATGF